jgi:hypothetical protein
VTPETPGDLIIILTVGHSIKLPSEVTSVLDDPIVVIGIDAFAIGRKAAPGMDTSRNVGMFAGPLISVPAAGSGFARQTTAEVKATISMEPNLEFESEATWNVASAVLEDDSRILLNADNGLALFSSAEAVVTVDNTTQLATVVKDTDGGDTDLVRVEWQPSRECGRSTGQYSTASVSFNVAPPSVESISTSLSTTKLVCTGDIATKTPVSYPSFASMTVSATYVGGQTKPQIQTDPRVTFISSDETIATVNEDGTISANAEGKTGTVVIVAFFKGVNHSQAVNVQKFERLVIRATSYPDTRDAVVGGSGSISLSPIKFTIGPVYEAAQMKTDCYRIDTKPCESL